MDARTIKLDAGLVVHRAHPLNAETSVPALMGGVVMPNGRFYIRNHFQIPNLNAADYRLVVGGLVRRKLSLSLRDLMQMPSQTLFATLECAGNGRTEFDPPIPGEKWAFGAVSTAEWTGVPLKAVLDHAGIESSAREVLFRGADRGTVEGSSGTIRFERSLRLDEAGGSGAILAYVMNGEPLPIHHGFPLRLIVPSWYAVASVKWLTDIELIGQPFAGHFQTKKYCYEWQRGSEDAREPVTRMQVRALITEPNQGSEIERGDIAIRGVAWSGIAPIERVEVNTGGAWHQANLIGQPSRQAWQRWELVTRINAPGPAMLRARATDSAGRVQPEHAEWNRLGYGNNSIQEVAIRVGLSQRPISGQPKPSDLVSTLVTGARRRRRCLLLAQSGHANHSQQCPLLGVKRTSTDRYEMSTSDPMQTSTEPRTSSLPWLC